MPAASDGLAPWKSTRRRQGKSAPASQPRCIVLAPRRADALRAETGVNVDFDVAAAVPRERAANQCADPSDERGPCAVSSCEPGPRGVGATHRVTHTHEDDWGRHSRGRGAGGRASPEFGRRSGVVPHKRLDMLRTAAFGTRGEASPRTARRAESLEREGSARLQGPTHVSGMAASALSRLRIPRRTRSKASSTGRPGDVARRAGVSRTCAAIM